MINSQELKDEIINDPEKMGYAAQLAIGSDSGVVEILNAVTDVKIPLTKVSRNYFLKGLRPAYQSLKNLPASVQAGWDRVISTINTGDVIEIDDTTKAMLAEAVADEVLTSGQADAIWHRPGTRAEVLWGADTIVTQSDVSFALRGVK